MKTFHQIRSACEAHAIAEAEKDLAFAGLAKDKQTFATALKEYAATGAVRALQFAKANKWITYEK